MSILIWIFSTSLIIVFVMISYRAYEIKYNKNIISIPWRQKTDFFIKKKFYKFLDFSFSLLEKVIFFLKSVPHVVNSLLHWIWRKISSRIDRYFEKWRGRKSIGKKGAVSVYWQEIGKDEFGDI